jgi:predicted metal-binding membrane protein
VSAFQHAATASPAGHRLHRVAWRHPEWWSLAASAAAWLALALGASAGHHASAWDSASRWLLMIVAMMVPLVLGSVRVAAERSLWRRRDRAMALFIVGYLAPWLPVGLLASALAAHVPLESPAVAAAAFGVAAAWQLTPMKRRALLACHRTAPLAPRGWRADRDCLRYGSMIGQSCLVGCWALMLACHLAGHGITTMACVGAVGVVERYIARPDRWVTLGVPVVLALLEAARAL